MALTIAVLAKPVTPTGESVTADVTFDASYVTGGLSLLPSDLGLKSIKWLDAQEKGVASRIAQYDYAASKLKLFTALGTEAGNASNQSTIVVRVLAFGPLA